MARAHYLVVLHEKQWKINLAGRRYGAYDTRRAAVRAAIDSALRAGKAGHRSQVLAQDADGQLRAEWTFGHDPYPPPGAARLEQAE
jgi:Uncharacterized protein conserved in bacteria (DUF2188)